MGGGGAEGRSGSALSRAEGREQEDQPTWLRYRRRKQKASPGWSGGKSNRKDEKFPVCVCDIC